MAGLSVYHGARRVVRVSGVPGSIKVNRGKREGKGTMRRRPQEIVEPGPDQESVWDYPRPPRVEKVGAPVRVELDGILIAETTNALRVCETASPPTYYIPPEDIQVELLRPSPRRSTCEWKGGTVYWTISTNGDSATEAAWSYPDPRPGFEAIKDHLAFYPRKVDAWVGEHRVRPQPGGFYGGWVTPDLVGPFKGEPGTEGW